MSEYVLVKSGNFRPNNVYHYPSDENPDRPKCNHGDREHINYSRKEPESVPNHRACKQCTGTVSENHHTGKKPSTMLKELDASEVGL